MDQELYVPNALWSPLESNVLFTVSYNMMLIGSYFTLWSHWFYLYASEAKCCYILEVIRTYTYPANNMF